MSAVSLTNMRCEYLPKGNSIWLLRDDSGLIISNHYCWWFEFYGEASLFAKQEQPTLTKELHGPVEFHRAGRANTRGKPVYWLLFDLCNGHPNTHRYCWWFQTFREAQAHLKNQRSMEFGAKLSRPYKFICSVTPEEAKRRRFIEKLRKLRAEIVASGEPLLTLDEINKELGRG